MGYYVIVDEMDRHGNKHELRKWIPGNAHAGMKWLAARRPQVYREQKEVRHHMDADGLPAVPRPDGRGAEAAEG
jgi:hypothetical protein